MVLPGKMSSVCTKSRSERYTILISDDDPGVRRALQLLLRSRGYTVFGYTSGRALLEDPQAKNADFIILDYRMPDIDGLVILNRLRRQGWQGGAILISGFYDDTLARRAREAGFDQVIPKPIIGRAVLDAVRRHSLRPRGTA